MKHLFITGGMLLGALAIIVTISQVLDVVMRQKAPATAQGGPSSKPDGGITRLSQRGPGPRGPLFSSAAKG